MSGDANGSIVSVTQSVSKLARRRRWMSSSVSSAQLSSRVQIRWMAASSSSEHRVLQPHLHSIDRVESEWQVKSRQDRYGMVWYQRTQQRQSTRHWFSKAHVWVSW